MYRLLTHSFIFLAALSSWPAQALQEDWEQEIVILSNRAELDRKANTVIYSGDVVLTQGTLRIESDKLTVHSDGENLDKAIAEGAPARYQQQTQPESPLTHAHALRIEYLAKQQEALLVGQAQVTQDGNIMKGERIHYDMNAEVIQASKDGDTPSRIKVVIQPQNTNKGAKP